jgi:hypothetical protein
MRALARYALTLATGHEAATVNKFKSPAHVKIILGMVYASNL